MDTKAAPGQDAPPPAYDPNGNPHPSQPMPAAHLPGHPGEPGQPIAMQPMGQPGMDTAGQTVTPLNLLSETPQWVDCQMCQQRTRTRVEKKGEGMQFLTGFLLCLVCICLAPLPCCLHWFEETNWYCEKCGKQIAMRTHETPVQVLPPPHALSVPSQYTQPDGAPGQQPVGSPQAMPVGSPPPVASPGAPVGAPVDIAQAPAQLPEQPAPVKN